MEIALLSREFDRKAFDCGIAALNDFLKTSAFQNQEKRASRTFVLYEPTNPKVILGYYSLSAGQIDLESLPEAQRKRLPKHPVPVARIRRLAVSAASKRQGYGKLLLADALKRIKTLSQDMGIYATVVDAKNSEAVSFYEKYGFIRYADQPMVLFMPVASIP